MHISEYFKLKIVGHEDILFVDVDESDDTQLYLAPYVIQALDDDFCIEAQKYIDSFFTEVFKTCKSRNLEKLRRLLQYASEPNETNLGMKRISKYGKGSTSDNLSKLFMDYYKIVCDNPNVNNNPMSLCMYIKRFDKDHMSDLITNILRKLLHAFTLEQCYEWGIPISAQNRFLGYYWDYGLKEWKKLYGPALMLKKNQHILLVPKHIVRHRYVCNVECYIRQYILKLLQQWHLINNTDLCIKRECKNGHNKIIPPTIEDLYNREVVGRNPKDYARMYSKLNAESEKQYLQDILARIRNGNGELSDENLDSIVYSNYLETHSA